VQADLAGASGDREVPGIQPGAFLDPRAGVQQHRDDRGIAGASARGRAAEGCLLLAGERVWLAGPGDTDPPDGDAEAGLLVHQGDCGQRLVDRCRAGPGGEHVPLPCSDGTLGAD
jgi:hypothetical protein